MGCGGGAEAGVRQDRAPLPANAPRIANNAPLYRHSCDNPTTVANPALTPPMRVRLRSVFISESCLCYSKFHA